MIMILITTHYQIVTMNQGRFCKAGYCRYKFTHVTKGHKCGLCGIYGHGNAECYDNISIYNLEKYHDDVLPDHMQCTVSNCATKKYHTVEAHHCSKCGIRDPHDEDSCSKSYDLNCPVCRAHNTFKNPIIIKGLSDECCICYAKNVEVLFPTCKHCVLCMECLEKM